MIIAHSDTPTAIHTQPEPLQPGERVHYVTGGGRTFRLATIEALEGWKIRIRLDGGLDGKDAGKIMRVRPWNVRRAA